MLLTFSIPASVPSYDWCEQAKKVDVIVKDSRWGKAMPRFSTVACNNARPRRVLARHWTRNELIPFNLSEGDSGWARHCHGRRACASQIPVPLCSCHCDNFTRWRPLSSEYSVSCVWCIVVWRATRIAVRYEWQLEGSAFESRPSDAKWMSSF